MTPTTRAGQHFHRMLFGEWDNAVDGPKRMHEDVIAAIEAEARQQERERLIGLVEVMDTVGWDDALTTDLRRAAVLSILRGEDS